MLRTSRASPHASSQSEQTATPAVMLAMFHTAFNVAAAIVFLLSEAAAFITGSYIRVDGGVPNARPTWKLIAHDRSKPFNGFLLYRPPRCLQPEAGEPS